MPTATRAEIQAAMRELAKRGGEAEQRRESASKAAQARWAKEAKRKKR